MGTAKTFPLELTPAFSVGPSVIFLSIGKSVVLALGILVPFQRADPRPPVKSSVEEVKGRKVIEWRSSPTFPAGFSLPLPCSQILNAQSLCMLPIRAYVGTLKLLNPISKPVTNIILSDSPPSQLPNMPKAPSSPPYPLNGLFPIEKPSGPSSYVQLELDSHRYPLRRGRMRCIDMITPLLLESRLFDDPEKLRQPQSKAKKKQNKTHMGLKIGQGGTLDPLADGVLGTPFCH